MPAIGIQRPNPNAYLSMFQLPAFMKGPAKRVAGFAVLVTAIILPLLGRMKVSVEFANRKKQA